MRVIIALLTMIPVIAFCQEKIKQKPRPFHDGYIIYSDDRGKEEGLVQVPEKKRGLDKCYFRKSMSGVVREIRPEQVVAVGFRNGEVYYTVDYTHGDTPGKFFVKALAVGNVSLFSDNDALILQLENDTTFELTTSNYRDVLQAATVTCRASTQMAQYLRFDSSVLTDFVKAYNKCLKNDPSTFDPFERKKKIYIGISSGIEFITLEIEGLAYYPTYSLADEKHFFAGLLLYFPFAKSQALEFGVIYKPREFYGTGKGGSPGIHPGVRTSQITVSYHELMIPVTFRQALWRKNKTTLHGSAGVSFPVVVSQSAQISTQDSFNSFTKPVTLSKSIQYNFGIGFEIAVKERHRLLIQNVIFFGPASLSTFVGFPRSSFIGYSLSIGYAL